MKENSYGFMRNMILVSMIVVPAIPFFLVVILGYSFFATSSQSQTRNQMTRIVEDHENRIESFLNERKADLEFIADSYSFGHLILPDKLDEIFTNLQKKSNAFIDIGVFNADGLHVSYHGPFELAGKMYNDEQWFQKVMEHGYYVSDVFLGFRKVPHFIVAVVKTEGNSSWILRATIDPSYFSDVVEKIRIGKTGEAYLLNKEGKFQTQRRSGGDLMEPDPVLASQVHRHAGVETFVKSNADGDKYVYATMWLANQDWVLVTRQEKAEAFRDLSRLTYLVIIVSLLGGLAIVTTAFQVTRRIINKMKTTETEKTELGRQLVVAGRLAEIGEMSAGFAHEINNPLQIIKSELTLTETIMDDLQEKKLLEESEDVEEIRDSLRQIRIQVDRCGGITQGLLKFARQKESKITGVNLESYIPEILKLVKNKASVEGIDIKVNVTPGTPEAKADPVQLEQVMVNLLNNAIYAIVERHGSSGGQLQIIAEPGEDSRIVIAITDNGGGITPENMEKIFTPFFTTKPVGKGTGLGLSICYGIITKMGGQMEVDSLPGHGTTFRIKLGPA
jgi:two-component system, NtrC family, sensor kinase